MIDALCVAYKPGDEAFGMMSTWSGEQSLITPEEAAQHRRQRKAGMADRSKKKGGA